MTHSWKDDYVKPGDAMPSREEVRGIMGDPPEATDEQIYDALKAYANKGVIEYVLPTEPLGEQWVLGQSGTLVKLIGKDQALAWLAGASAMTVWTAQRMGLSL